MTYQPPQSRYVLPSFVERTSYGVKESNPYNKLFEERIIFLGAPIDDVVANDVMAQLICLESTDPDTPVATFAPPATAGFWGRRMAHETLIHRWDAESAHGQPGPFDAELAADGIDEGLNVFVPFVRAGSQVKGSGETFHIHRTDGEGEWLVTVEDSGVRVSREHAKGDVALRGRAEDLLLWLWHRTPPDNLEVFGDPALLDRWFELIPPV